MNHRRILNYGSIFALLYVQVFTACSDYLEIPDIPRKDPKRIEFKAKINQDNSTRADEYGFADGDRFGVFIVNHHDGLPGILSLNSNHVNNAAMTFHAETGIWSSPSELYWLDETTPADFYGYYPFDNSLSDVESYRFEVKANQSYKGLDGELSNYEASDFLWAKNANAQPGETVRLVFNHRLAGVKVILEKGTGFDNGEWEKLPKTVTVANTVRTASINLADGSIIPDGDCDYDVIMNTESGCYRAVVIPQDVAPGKTTIGITIDGTSYNYTRSEGMTYVAGKLHNFTMKVDKNSSTGKYSISLTNQSITDWESDASSHEFEANSYFVVECPEAGKLKETISAMGADYKTVKNLKVSGILDETDCFFMRDEMEQLTSLNLKEARFPKVKMGWDYNMWCDIYAENALPSAAFSHNNRIRRYILPESIKEIGTEAFSNTQPSSTIIIPESVTKIGKLAFSYIWEQAEIVLPGKLEYIGDGAFQTQAKFELRLPQTLKHIGVHAFQGAKNAYGTFSIPPNLEYLAENAFAGTGNNMTGDAVFPAGIMEAIDFEVYFANGTNVTIPEGVRRIVRLGGKFNSPVVLPQSLERLEYQAFYGTKFSSPVELPDGIVFIDSRAFLESNLEGRVEIPPLVDVIKSASFNCTRISEVIIGDQVVQIEEDAFGRNKELRYVEIGKNVEYIGRAAFSESHHLQTIVSFSKTPPKASEAFFDLDFQRTVLEVPAGCVDLYRNADGWRQFANITEHRELAFDTPEIECLEGGVTRTGILRAEGAWRVAECPGWIHVIPSSGKMKDEVEIKVDAQAYGSADREGEVVFSLDGKNYTHSVKVSQLSAEYPEDSQITLNQAASEGTPVPMIILGEGFTASDIVNGEYMKAMEKTMEQFFSIEPYKSLKKYFNVATAMACSPQEGVSSYHVKTYNKFSTYGVTPDIGKIRNYVSTNFPIANGNIGNALVIVVTNHNVFEGWSTICGDGLSIACIGKVDGVYPYDQRGLVQHYAGGAAFAGLGDENVTHSEHIKSCHCSNCNGLHTFLEMKGRGFYVNLSMSGKMNDAPWRDFIFHPNYSSDVDMWEGGHRHLRGIWRSETQSVMGTYISYYNAISRFAIWKEVMRRAGLTFSFDDFIANDIIEKP